MCDGFVDYLAIFNFGNWRLSILLRSPLEQKRRGEMDGGSTNYITTDPTHPKCIIPSPATVLPLNPFLPFSQLCGRRFRSILRITAAAPPLRCYCIVFAGVGGLIVGMAGSIWFNLVAEGPPHPLGLTPKTGRPSSYHSFLIWFCREKVLFFFSLERSGLKTIATSMVHAYSVAIHFAGLCCVRFSFVNGTSRVL